MSPPGDQSFDSAYCSAPGSDDLRRPLGAFHGLESPSDYLIRVNGSSQQAGAANPELLFSQPLFFSPESSLLSPPTLQLSPPPVWPQSSRRGESSAWASNRLRQPEPPDMIRSHSNPEWHHAAQAMSHATTSHAGNQRRAAEIVRSANSDGSGQSLLRTKSTYERPVCLLDLQAGSRKDNLEVHYIWTQLKDAPAFTALSYVVGTERDEISIFIRRQRTDRERLSRKITRNLAAALRRVRDERRDVLIWVDALSINHEDPAERAFEVRRLSEIFRAAAEVFVWLGSATERTDRAMKFIPQILDFESTDSAITREDDKVNWTCLFELMSKNWFRRRWCVQEILLARSVTICCGEQKMSWEIFQQAIELSQQKCSLFEGYFPRSRDYLVGDSQVLGAMALLKVHNSMLSMKRSRRGFSTLEYLLAALAPFEVTYAHDAIYSIMDLAEDVRETDGRLKIPVDYSIPPFELFAKVTELAITTSGSLDVICRPWAPDCQLPSWIVPVSKHQHQWNLNSNSYDRHHGASFVESLHGKRYRAGGEGIPRFEITLPSQEGLMPHLSALGFLIGRVDVVLDRCRGAIIPGEVLEVAGWPNPADPDSSPSANFVNTLVAGRSPAGPKAPQWYRSACKTTFRQRRGPDIDLTVLLRDRELRRRRERRKLKEFLNRVYDVTFGRRFATVLTEHGQSYLALCPAQTQVNDIVCVLRGCSVPVVLRKKRVQVKASSSVCELVGECYIDDLMEGEALEGFQEQEKYFTME